MVLCLCHLDSEAPCLYERPVIFAQPHAGLEAADENKRENGADNSPPGALEGKY